MKKVLVLGAGLVSRPLVRYLLDKGFEVTVASRTVSKAEELIKGHANGRAVSVVAEDKEKIKGLVKQTDLAVSLLPYTYHPLVAQFCLEFKKHLVTTSYVSPAMRAFDADAKANELIFLNEIGVDPGIDHMTAMRIINNVYEAGGKVTKFKSYCGGLPHPDANNNPFGYKFSWSPIGVVRAGKNSARYLENRKEIPITPENLFKTTFKVNVPGGGEFECYTNRDSIPYIELYGLKDVDTMFRGTLRNKGWCQTWVYIYQLGLAKEEEMNLGKDITYNDFMLKLIGKEPGKNSRTEIAKYLGIDEKSEYLERLAWLGLFGNDKIKYEKASPINIFVDVLQEKLKYEKDELDMLVLHHEFTAEYPCGSKKRITSTMLDYGIKNGDSSMARTVSLPAAIAVRLILEDKITARGVHIPVIPNIYNPVLDELEELGVHFSEKESPL